MNVYKIYFIYIYLIITGEYLALSSDDMWICLFSIGHMHQFDTALYSREVVSLCLCTLFVNDTEKIKANCNCELKAQTHNVAYNLNMN